MAPEIRSVTDRIFSHFVPFFAFLPPSPPPPPSNPENKNFEKIKKKKKPGDIINLHKCTKNNDLMLYCS